MNGYSLLHPIRRRHRRRELRAEEEALAREKTKGVENLRRYRTPVRVCPRGCGYHETARRDLILSHGNKGRALVEAKFVFETKNCPKCGAPLLRKCARCKHKIFAPVVDLCRNCGLPQPWAVERRAGADRASIRLWRPKKGKKKKGTEERANDPARLLYRSVKKKKKGKEKEKGKKWKTRGDLWVIDGNVVELKVDAVVSNDDVDGQMWAQVARAIKKAAGEGVERLAQEGKPFKLGQAWVTTPGNLQQMKGIIHVALMDRQGHVTRESVRKCLAAALELAVEEKYRSIGIGAIGSSRSDLKEEEWSKLFIETAIEFLSGKTKPKGKTKPLSIVLVLFEPTNFKKEVKALRKTAYEAWIKIDEPADGRPKWKPAEEIAARDPV
jgi:O-acetyl-ADP-ribose deacetylase (regulator of RNase III)